MKVAARGLLKHEAYGLAVKTSGRTGERAFYLSVPRRNWERHATQMLSDAGAEPHSTVYVDRPDWRGRIRRRRFAWR